MKVVNVNSFSVNAYPETINAYWLATNLNRLRAFDD